MNKKLLISLGIVAIVVGLLFAFAKPSGNDAAAKVIKIGVVGPFTGPKSQMGEGIRQAIILAQKDYGAVKNQYEFIYEDTASDPAKAASAAQKLTSIDRVRAIISFPTQDAVIVSKIAEAKKVPHIGIGSSEEIEKGEYNFANWPSADVQASLFVQELVRRNIKSAALIIEQNDAWYALRESFKKFLKDTDIKIVYEDEFAKDTTSFRTLLQKAKVANPEIVIIQAYSPMAENFKKQMDEIGIKIPVTGLATFQVIKDPSAYEGSWYVSARLPNSNFFEDFKKQAGYPVTVAAQYGYDNALILLDVFEHHPKSSGFDLKEALKSLDYSTVKSSVGVLKGLTPEGRIISEAQVLRVKGGVSVPDSE